ncbi:hypothetical protein X749_31360 [Mesorhizobium sp. LNJC391B00]|nr:hypothetical protein X749_31360 [Mesorhizobium sp. LNJC391B00]
MFHIRLLQAEIGRAGEEGHGSVFDLGEVAVLSSRAARTFTRWVKFLPLKI